VFRLDREAFHEHIKPETRSNNGDAQDFRFPDLPGPALERGDSTSANKR
jgi:hypothetical protein